MEHETPAKSEPVLVVDSPDAQRVQAQLTRFQMALCLKKQFEPDGEPYDIDSVWNSNLCT